VKQSEEADERFAKTIGAPTLAALRAKSATDLLHKATREKELRFAPNIDGYFLPEDVYAIYAAGNQRHIPLLAGWNADEGSYKSIFNKESPTLQNYVARVHALYGENASTILNAYKASNDTQAKRAAQDLAGDRFIGYSTWKWIEMQNATGEAPVYRYRFEDAPPLDPSNPESASHGAYHSAEIEFVFEALASKHLPWRPEDRKLSGIMATYWSNFAKNGNPNGDGLAKWPVYTKDSGYQIMHLVAEPHAGPDGERARYEALDSITSYPAESK